MVKLYKGGAYLLHGTEVIADAPDALAAVKSKTGIETTKEAAAKETMAYGILSAHNTSGNMQQLQIKFDKLTSHDITFVGIIQTARASGLEKFPIPYVLTNCHNSLCAVGGTINEDDHMFGLTCAKKYGGVDNSVHYFRDEKGLEVDLIVEHDGRWGAIEVKLSDAKADDGARNLKALERKVLSNPAAQNAAPAFLAVVVGKGGIAYTRDDGVAVIPMAALGA